MVAVALLGAGVGCSADQQPGPVAAPATPLAVERTPDAVIDTGQAVLITDGAVLPRQLLTVVGKPVEFRNEGTAPLSVRFLVGRVASPVVAPGASWSWTPDALGTFGFTVLGGVERRGVVLPELPD